MKKLLLILGTLLLVSALVIGMVACGTGSDETTGDGEGHTPSGGEIVLFDNGSTNYIITYPTGAMDNPSTGATMKSVLTQLRAAFRANNVSGIMVLDDNVPLGKDVSEVAPQYEILVGNTNRPEDNVTEGLAFNEAVIRVVGDKVVICGSNSALTAQAVLEFIKLYLPEGTTTLTLPKDLDKTVILNMNESTVNEMSYSEMAEATYDAFNDAFWYEDANGGWPGSDPWWWDAAEILETYIDAYEATKDPVMKDKMIKFAKKFIRNHGASWAGNDYNDDIMWACIGFARIGLLTGDELYTNYAKRNFDIVWNRAWDTRLGGGLYWMTDNTTKNSCVNCPAAIAACLIGDFLDDDSYYQKAIQIMDWEIKWMFNESSGAVYDAYPLAGEIQKWASTYNQGTFIGACTLLYQYTGDETYLKQADKAAKYVMKSDITDNGGILNNGEGNPGKDNRDLIGFKGILTRWLYRYAKQVEDVEILSFLQHNADVAFSNRNADGLIWTNWGSKAPDEMSVDDGYYTFGISTAVALMFNCQQWW